MALKHKGVLDQLSESIRKKGKRLSVRQAMLNEGYSESYANQAGITRTKSYPKLLEEIIPSSELAVQHRVLLYDKEITHYIFPKSNSDKQIKSLIESFGFQVIKIQKQGNWKRAYFSIINARAKKDALDMAYKIKKLYTNGTIDPRDKYGGKTHSEIAEETARRIVGLLGAGRRKDSRGKK